MIYTGPDQLQYPHLILITASSVYNFLAGDFCWLMIVDYYINSIENNKPPSLNIKLYCKFQLCALAFAKNPEEPQIFHQIIVSIIHKHDKLYTSDAGNVYDQ